jgi:hypothetical protein
MTTTVATASASEVQWQLLTEPRINPSPLLHSPAVTIKRRAQRSRVSQVRPVVRRLAGSCPPSLGRQAAVRAGLIEPRLPMHPGSLVRPGHDTNVPQNSQPYPQRFRELTVTPLVQTERETTTHA